MRRHEEGSPSPRNRSAASVRRALAGPFLRLLPVLGRAWLRGFMLVFRLDDWIRRRLTPAGQLFGCFLIAAMVFGVNTRATSAYVLAALMGGLLLTGFAFSALHRPRLRLERRLPRYGMVGELSEYPIRVVNLGRRALEGVQLEERLQHGLPRFRDMRAALSGAGMRESASNVFDRIVGYPRFQALMRVRLGARTRAVGLSRLEPGASTEVPMRLTPTRRGEIRMSALSVVCTDPLGLVRAERRIPLNGRFLALPRRDPLPTLRLSTGARSRRKGGDRTAARGGANELCGVREYRPGDPLRHIDWRGFARLGVPVVKQFEERVEVNAMLFLDVAVPTRAPFEEAVSVAASIALGATSGGRSDLQLDGVQIGDHVFRLTRHDDLGRNTGLLDALACVQPAAEDDFAAHAARLRSSTAGASAVVWVAAGWDARRDQLLDMLGNVGIQVTLVKLIGDALPLDSRQHADSVRVVSLRLQHRPAGNAAAADAVSSAWGRSWPVRWLRRVLGASPATISPTGHDASASSDGAITGSPASASSVAVIESDSGLDTGRT
ncbi:MAG: DUF58 domain-containing protein [Gammaproteobacteria bacterium]|nr:DUF58 domain-containing protein [Gammaproteobacteria bacterium]